MLRPDTAKTIEKKIRPSLDGVTTIHVADEVVSRMAEGLGANWLSGWREGTYPAADDEVRWTRLLDHLTWLNPRFIRFGQPASRLCDEAGHFRADETYTFGQLERLDAWAMRHGATLQLDLWSVPRVFQYDPWPGAPLPWGKPNSRPSLGVRDIDKYVDRLVVPYLRHVLREMRCRSVEWFNFTNEPLQGGKGACPNGVDDHVRYVETWAAIRQALSEAGLTDIKLMGPDTNSHKYWPIPRMVEAGHDLDPHIDGYCMHQYHSRFDWAPPSGNVLSDPMTVSIEQQLRTYCRYAHKRGKPYFVTEVGMFYYGWGKGDPSGVATHDSAILESEFFIRAMNEGCDGLLRWTLINPGDFDGHWQVIHTADGSDRIEPHPYYGAATLMRYVGRRAGILKSVVTSDAAQPQTIHATSVSNPDGTRSLLVVNDSYADAIEVQIELAGFAGELHRVVNDRSRKHQVTRAMLDCDGAAAFTDVLTPLSLTVYTTAGTD